MIGGGRPVIFKPERDMVLLDRSLLKLESIRTKVFSLLFLFDVLDLRPMPRLTCLQLKTTFVVVSGHSAT